MRNALLLLTLTLISLTSTAGGPWLRKKNGGFYQLHTTFLPRPYYSMANGKPVIGDSPEDRLWLSRNVTTYDFGAYVEYGLLDNLTLIGKLPFKYAVSGSRTDSLYSEDLLDEGSIFGMGNLELAAKYGLIDKKVKVAVSLTTTWNTTSKELEKGLITGFDYNAFGLFSHVGVSLGERVYAYTDIGLVHTTNNFSDYYQQYISVGRRFGRAFWLNLNLDIRRSLKNGTYHEENLIQTGLHPNNQEWIGFNLEAIYETKNKVGFTFSTGGAIRARYIGVSAPTTISVYKKI